MTDNGIEFLRVRPAHAGDRANIEAAQSETAKITFGRPATEEESSRRGERLSHALEADVVKVAESGGSFAGYWYLDTSTNGLADLVDFYVAPRLRGTGVADRMLRSSMESAARSGVRTIRLVIADRNAASRAFFIRMGAECIDAEPSEEGLRRYEIRLREPL